MIRHFVIALIAASLLSAAHGIATHRDWRALPFPFFFLLTFLATWSTLVWLRPFSPSALASTLKPVLAVVAGALVFVGSMLVWKRWPRTPKDGSPAKTPEKTASMVRWGVVALLAAIAVAGYVLPVGW
jgi:hypothetical protein